MNRTEILDERIRTCQAAHDEPESEETFRCICDERIAELEVLKATLPQQAALVD